MGFPWDSHGNGNEKHISMGMGVGMGMISVGVGMSKNIWIRNSILFMYFNFWNALEIKAFCLLP